MNENALAAAINFHQAGQLDQAAAAYHDLLKIDPDNADAIHLLGVICFQKGDLETARQQVVEAIRLDNSVALYYANLGRIEKALGQTTAAIAAYRKSLALEPGQADVNSDISAALIDVGECTEALKFAENAVNLSPEFSAGSFNQGLALVGLGEFDKAVSCFEKAVQLDAGFLDAWFQLAQLRQNLGELEQAELAYRAVISLEPGQTEALCNLGNVLRVIGRLSEALDCYDAALSILPDLAEVHSNKGVALHELGEREQAISCYRRAIQLKPDDAEAHRNLSMALLQGGEFEEGWREFEWRWQTGHFSHIRRDWREPQWSGQDLKERTVLVHAEQGFGDTFQFCRYIPMLAERGAYIIVEAPEAVHGVLTTLAGVGEIVALGSPLPAFDFHIPMMSLPGAFKTVEGTFPAPEFYLSAPEESARSWLDRFRELDGEKRIGIVWKGSAEHSRNLWRSPGLEVFRPLFDLDRFKFVSLQKDDGNKDLIDAGLIDRVVDLELDLKTFSDTAAAISSLDLVISPDTSVAHLSAALGCQTWIMLPHVAEWRWGIGGEECPWYPSARLFRQHFQGDWDGLVLRLIDELSG
jgi:tetratricopeptide (TPR) repeat protein